jgi:hypothetical protein
MVMPIIVDTHVHIYPCYDVHQAFDCALRNLAALETKLGVKASKAICITQGREPAVKLPEIENLFVFHGFQIITEEKLEVLALLASERVADGKSLAQTIKLIREDGGIAVLPWSFGKWWFKRGKILRAYLDSEASGNIMLGDIPLRSCNKELVIANYKKTVAGTDPLPISGEEKKIGSFATLIEGALDDKDPEKSFRIALQNNLNNLQITGERNSPFEAFGRMLRLKLRI